MKALGMIEVYGYLAAVEALDSALKAANVTLVDVTLVRGGLVTVLITGDVGAVKASMDASKSAAERVGKVITVHVIPRPSEEILKIVPIHSTNTAPLPKEPSAQYKQKNITPSGINKPQPEPGIQNDESQAKVSSVKPMTEKIINTDKKMEEVKNAETKFGEVDCNQITVDQMKAMTVERLRSLARELGITKMTKKQIRSATKHELIESISEYIEQER